MLYNSLVLYVRVDETKLLLWYPLVSESINFCCVNTSCCSWKGFCGNTINLIVLICESSFQDWLSTWCCKYQFKDNSIEVFNFRLSTTFSTFSDFLSKTKLSEMFMHQLFVDSCGFVSHTLEGIQGIMNFSAVAKRSLIS